MSAHETGWTVRHRHGHRDTWHPGCTCGWNGPVVHTETMAVALCDQHLADIKEINS